LRESPWNVLGRDANPGINHLYCKATLRFARYAQRDLAARIGEFDRVAN
jgi:hypothetical protein